MKSAIAIGASALVMTQAATLEKHHHKHDWLNNFVQTQDVKEILAHKAPGNAQFVESHVNAKGDATPFSVDVPIDEVDPINVRVAPTHIRDTVESVTLKSFRKMIGYDTFNSILKGNRNEDKEIMDHYNITMTIMVKRDPISAITPPPKDLFQDGTKTLGQILDKGFPYDDGDMTLDSTAAKFNAKAKKATIIGKLNGENVTKEGLKNLVTDADSPITKSLLQLEKSDSDGLFKLMDSNVTRGNLKNLVTDKPAPITVALAQKSDSDGLFKLMDSNVTRGNLKNLVTDKPAPITVALAQKSDSDGLFKLMDSNVTRGNLKNLVTDKPAPITVALAQKSDSDGLFKLMDSNVTRGNLKNLVTDKPAPITVALAQTSSKKDVPIIVNPESVLYPNTEAATTLFNETLMVGPDEITAVQLKSKNPVINPPFNNWSVNQPSAPHDRGMSGKDDLGVRDIIIDGVNGYDFVQTKFDDTMTTQTSPGDFKIIDHDDVDSTVLQLNEKMDNGGIRLITQHL